MRWAAETLNNPITSVPHLYASSGTDRGDGGPVQRTFNGGNVENRFNMKESLSTRTRETTAVG